jgi:FixJ family two-component response regulator
MERILLLVDDEPNILNAIERVLRRDGYAIHKATSGADGLKLLAAHDVGVIVSDQRMPEMTGVEFLERSRAVRPDAVRIALSGYTELESVVAAVNRGAVFRFLTKPWDDAALRADIAEAFSYHELKAENRRLQTALENANRQLLDMNTELASQVAETVADATFRQQTLEGFQDLIEALPVPVIGLADDGLIAISNRAADLMFMPDGGSLVSCLAELTLPHTLNALLGQPDQTDMAVALPGAGARVVNAHIRRLGGAHGQGVLLTLVP